MKSALKIYVVCSISLLLVAAPAFAQWLGHSSKLGAAQIACRSLDSAACLPYLAEAVAVADTLKTQAKVSRDVLELPGPNGVVVRCSERFSLTDLNGETLAHMALTRDQKLNSYWSNALFVAALDLCRNRS